MQVRLVVAEAARSLKVSMSTTVAATLTVLIGMFVLGLAIGLGTWVLSWSDHIKKELVVKVFFDSEVSPRQVNRVRQTLVSNPQVKSIKYVSPQEGLKIVKKAFPVYANVKLPYNPLGPAYTIYPKKGEYVEAIAQTLAPKPAGVHEVTYGKKTAKKVLSVARLIEIVFLIGVFILLIASTLLIANTIRLSIFSRRREIEVMKLVGATNWFVRGPFMLEGLLCGLGGSLGAVVLLLVGKEIALPAILGHINDSRDVSALAFELNALIILGTGLVLGAAGSGLTLRRFLRV